MQIIFVLLLLGAVTMGIGIGVVLTVEHYQAMKARQHANEEELAEIEELYAAQAALRAGLRPLSGNTWHVE